jgi:hypothetical protein
VQTVPFAVVAVFAEAPRAAIPSTPTFIDGLRAHTPAQESTRMNASTLGLLGVLAAQSAALQTFVVRAVPDVTITTRRTIDHADSSISTTFST